MTRRGIDICFSGGEWVDGEPVALASGGRRPFTGSHQQVASDIRAYERLGVSHLALGFGRPTLSEMLGRIELFATEVMPLVGGL